MQSFYFREDGSYDEHPDKRKGPRQPDPTNQTWWDQLPESHRSIIRWYNALPGFYGAASRELRMQAFVRHMGVTEPMKKAAYYDFVAANFDGFQEFMKDKTP